MLSVAGYYDGVSIQAVEEIRAKANQRVIITFIDEYNIPEFTNRKKEISSFISLAGNIDIDDEAVKNIREDTTIGNC